MDGAVVEAGADEAVADDGFVTFVQVGVAVDRVGVVMFSPPGMVVSEGFLNDRDLAVEDEAEVEVPVTEDRQSLVVRSDCFDGLAAIEQRNGGNRLR